MRPNAWRRTGLRVALLVQAPVCFNIAARYLSCGAMRRLLLRSSPLRIQMYGPAARLVLYNAVDDFLYWNVPGLSLREVVNMAGQWMFFTTPEWGDAHIVCYPSLPLPVIEVLRCQHTMVTGCLHIYTTGPDCGMIPLEGEFHTALIRAVLQRDVSEVAHLMVCRPQAEYDPVSVHHLTRLSTDWRVSHAMLRDSDVVEWWESAPADQVGDAALSLIGRRGTVPTYLVHTAHRAPRLMAERVYAYKTFQYDCCVALCSLARLWLAQLVNDNMWAVTATLLAKAYANGALRSVVQCAWSHKMTTRHPLLGWCLLAHAAISFAHVAW